MSYEYPADSTQLTDLLDRTDAMKVSHSFDAVHSFLVEVYNTTRALLESITMNDDVITGAASDEITAEMRELALAIVDVELQYHILEPESGDHLKIIFQRIHQRVGQRAESIDEYVQMKIQMGRLENV